MPKIRNIIIFISIAAVFVLIYVFFIQKPDLPESNLISSPSTTLPGVGEVAPVAGEASADSAIAENFLNQLLGVKNIKLNDAIFSEPAWANLKDSSITLTPDGNEGRPNPFAPLGFDNAVVVTPPPASDSTTTPPPATNPTLPPSKPAGATAP